MIRKGFTLLEILVATAIFMVVMVVAVGIFSSTVASSSTSTQLRVTAQSARYVFESMTREIRSAHGLAYTQTDGSQIFLIKPFTMVFSSGNNPHPTQISIYQVKNIKTDPDGTEHYSVTRKTYQWDTTGVTKTITLLVEVTTDLTTDQIVQATSNGTKDLPGMTPQATATSLLPSDHQLNDFQVLNYALYPQKPDDQTYQPFVEIQLSVKSKASLFVSNNAVKAQTTLRTTIVPRDFTSPYEVVQQGVTSG